MPNSHGMRILFDRGTIVLLDLPSVGACSDLPGFKWDQRISAPRFPARFHGPLLRELHRQHVPFADEVTSPLDMPLTAPIAVPLRPYQDAALTAWELSDRRGLAILPTGAGKTRVAIAAIARLCLPTLVLVPTCVLLDQWTRAIEEILGRKPGRLGDGDHQIEPITVATFESGWRHMHRLGNHFSFLVVDEAHHFGTGQRDEALDMCVAPCRLGLTATPPKGAALDPLIERLGPVVYELKVEDLVGEFLAPFDSVVLHVDFTHAERERYDALMAVFSEAMADFRRRFPGGSFKDFAALAAKSEAGRNALTAWRQARHLTAFPTAKRTLVKTLLEKHRDCRTILFTADNPTAYAISRRHLIMPLTCDIKRAERDAALAKFRTGEFTALVSAQVLNEGLDVPDAEVGIIVAGSKGEREHVQRVGRVLRPRPGKRALVYELVVRSTSEISQGKRRRSALAA